MTAFAAAAQDDGVAALEAKGRSVRANVRAAFVDHADHADRHGNALDAEAVGAFEGRELAADGVGQFGDFFQRLGHALDAVFGQAQAVDEAFRLLAFHAGDVLAVRIEQLWRRFAQRLGGFAQGGVLRLGTGGNQAARCLTGALTKIVDMDLRVECLVGHDVSSIKLLWQAGGSAFSAARPPGRSKPARSHAGVR